MRFEVITSTVDQIDHKMVLKSIKTTTYDVITNYFNYFQLFSLFATHKCCVYNTLHSRLSRCAPMTYRLTKPYFMVIFSIEIRDRYDNSNHSFRFRNRVLPGLYQFLKGIY